MEGWSVGYRKGGKAGHLDGLSGAKCLQQQERLTSGVCLRREKNDERDAERKKTKTNEKKGGM